MPQPVPARNNRRLALSLLAGTCLGLSCLSGTAFAASVEIAQPEDRPSFDAIDFAINPVRGEIRARARSGWAWREGTTHRMQLVGDVEVTLAGSQFVARSASMWLRKVGDGEDGDIYQVYAVFEDMRSADGTVTMRAQRMPVRGVIELSSPIRVALDARFSSPPKRDSEPGRLLANAEQVFAERVLGLDQPQATQQQSRPWSAPMDRGDATTDATEPTTNQQVASNAQSAPTAGDRPPTGPVFDADGIFSVAIGGRVVIDGVRGGTQSIITADGGVKVQYLSPSTRRWVDFSAERVVIYTRGDEPVTGVSQFGTGQIEGIYLEGGVYAGDAQWSVRAPRMYLDVVNNKALMLDTVFWTTDRETDMPLYVRAESVRQSAKDEFLAQNATISNTAFFEPDVTIGIKNIKVTLDTPSETEAESDPRPGVLVEAKSVTLKAGPVPILWLPGFKGDPGDFPLRQIQIGDSNRSGLALQTRWNALSLFKIDAPPGVEVDLNLDYYGERGFGVGVEAQWQTEKHKGGIFSYLLPEDNGTDITSSGRRIERDGETRGIFAYHDLWRVTNQWTLVSEFSYISDEAFVPSFFEQAARSTEAFRNRIVLERLSDDTQFSLELSSTVNDFIVPEHQLQSPGYSVNKTPEARFLALGKDLLPDIEPGLLTYSFEARAGVMRLSFSEVDAREYGLLSNSLADDAFGTTATQSLGDKFRALGLDESPVTRLDTRHELSSRLDMGPIRINPFLVGRFTAYDDDYALYSPAQDEEYRFWGAAGVTFSTTISKVDDSVESRFFDLHRIRHIVEPSITIWGSDSNFDRTDVPVYDDDVEDLLVGSAFRAAIDQTWQTKRGGVGRWRDVDIVKLRTEYVNIDDSIGSVPIPEYYSSRPELSNPGEYFNASMVVQPTDAFAIAGEWEYDLEQHSTAKSSIGAILENRPGLTTSVEYREVHPLDATFLTVGARYRLSDKYALALNANYNFRLDDFQSFNTQLLRRFQIGTLGATIRYNNIRGETSIGFIFRPLGAGNELPIDSEWGG